MITDRINSLGIVSMEENNQVLLMVQVNGLGQPILGLKRTFLSDKPDHLYSSGPKEVNRSYLVGTIGDFLVKISVVKWVVVDYIVNTIKKIKTTIKEVNKRKGKQMDNRRWELFKAYLKETGNDPDGNYEWFWLQQFNLQEEGIRDSRIHDAALIAYSRL